MRSSRTRVLFCAAVFALAAPAACAAERLLATGPENFKPVTMDGARPEFRIPPASRLACNEHPRFLLTAEDIETLRKRLADPRIARELEVIKKRSLGKRPWSLERAVAYRLTGDRKYLEAIKSSKSFRRPTWIFGWAAMIDLIWDELTPGERRELSDAVAKAIAKGGSQYWRPTLHMVSVFYEGGQGPNDGVFLERMKRDFGRTLVRWTDKLNGWAAGRGGSDMGHGYNGEHAYWEPFVAAMCWTHSTGEDYLSRAEFADYQSPFYWYHFIPELRPLSVEKIGVTRQSPDYGAVSPGHSGATNLVWLTIAREHDGLGVTWLDRLRSQEPAWGKDKDALGRLLWMDPDAKPLDYRTLPTTRLFPTSGHVIMRSDWTEGCTYATFRCGRFGEIDGTWGRNNADNLSFTIRKLGPLAIDSGPVHGQNVQVLKFRSKGAVYQYGRQTIAHNSITVGDSEFTHLDWRKRPTGNVVRRGGQSVCQAKEWWTKWGFGGPRKAFMEGRVSAYRTHPAYDYALGNARFSYNPDDVRECTRQFVYLKPDVFVIYDRVVVTDPANEPCWLFHSLREPKATGEEKALTTEEIGPQFIHDGKNRTPHPDPGGQFRMGGDGFSVESGSPGKEGAGWLKVQTLVPGGKAAERKKIGGRGHDFEVAGIQYGPTDEGYRKADGGYAVLSTVGLLGWRVELRHRKPSRAVEFLHVLQAGTGARAAAREATLRSTPATHTVTVEHAGRTFALTLRRTGKRGGRLRVTRTAGGRRLYDGALPGTVEDHWRHYRDDPNFRTWVTDPRYRVVIEPADEDRALIKGGELR